MSATAAGGPYATCPLCHTPDAVLTEQALAAGGDWCCATCAALWDTVRLSKVAAYRAWVVEHDHAAHAASSAPQGVWNAHLHSPLPARASQDLSPLALDSASTGLE